MRKLKLLMQTSLDGFVSTKDGKSNWMIWNFGHNWTWDAKLQKHFVNLHSDMDCILLSRPMAEEGYNEHWAGVDKNSPQYGFTKKISEAQKVIFTKTLKKSRWDNSILAKGDLSEEVNRLKQSKGGDIVVYGGASFVSNLIQQNLIDEFHLFVNPVALGKGLPIFKETTNLKLTDALSFSCGVAVLKYQNGK